VKKDSKPIGIAKIELSKWASKVEAERKAFALTEVVHPKKKSDRRDAIKVE